MAIATLYIFAWIKRSWMFSDPHFSFNGWFSLLIFYISWKNEENRRSLNFLQNTPWNSIHFTMRQFQMPLSQPKIYHLHNFGFLYDSINIRNSFGVKKIHKKMFFVREVVSENNSAILIILICRWQLLSSHCQIRRGHVTAKHMFHKTRTICNLGSSQSCCLVKSMKCLRKRKTDCVPFLRQSQD